MLAIVTDYVNNNTSLSIDSDLGALSVPGQLQVVIDAQDKFYVNSCNTLQFNL